MEYDHPSFDALGAPGTAFSAAADPGGIGAAVEAAFGPGREPVLAAPPDNTVYLPFGVLADGVAHRLAVVRELTGADDEALARVSGSYLRWVDTLVERGTVQVGGRQADKALLRELTVADRDTLLLAIRRVTYGDTHPIAGFGCPRCGQKSDLTVHLGDLEIREPRDPACRVYEVALRGGSATLRQPTGNDQIAFDDQQQRTVAEQNNLLLSRVIVSLEQGAGARAGSLAMARALGLADRKKLLDAIRENTYGPRYEEISMVHEACGQEVDVPLTPGELFLL